jgi:hypothetical protein
VTRFWLRRIGLRRRVERSRRESAAPGLPLPRRRVKLPDGPLGAHHSLSPAPPPRLQRKAYLVLWTDRDGIRHSKWYVTHRYVGLRIEKLAQSHSTNVQVVAGELADVSAPRPPPGGTVRRPLGNAKSGLVRRMAGGSTPSLVTVVIRRISGLTLCRPSRAHAPPSPGRREARQGLAPIAWT